MARTVQKVDKKRVIMALLSLVLINTGCEDRIDSSGASGEKMVEVSLNIGIADEADGYNLSVAPASKAGSPKNSAFNMQLTPTAATRAVSTKPDKLYKLEIRQYNQAGTSYLGGIDPTDKAIGETFIANLKEATNCQLVFVAWGQNSSKKLGSGNLASAQAITVDASAIKDIKPTDMNTMPYVLHLKNVNVTRDGKITSPSGEDVRVLLKRLAARLTLTWDYQVAGYNLQQILLQSIPLNYNVVAAPDEKDNNTYPSLLDQFTTIQLIGNEIAAGSYSCWIPANVRGTNPFASSPLHRIKSNAPTGSAYASFIAVNTNDYKKKLDYRVYLGGNDYTDFNLFGNTDYSYTVNFKHVNLPVNDRRVTIIDPIPASENNNNIVPTANCFMVAPGGAFCFDPFVYQQNGVPMENSSLIEWAKTGGIAYVKLLWQTKENGDVGDPIVGVVNSTDDHSNIVDIKRIGGGDVSKTSPVTNKDQARIYCRVAPNTTGGSGAIAAYNSNGEILWSWHIWVTDYNPSPTGDEDIQTPENKRKLKYSRSGLSNQLPMMDRNLGAITGSVTVPTSELERSKTNGFHYQWGRKDPFRSSYTSKKMDFITAQSIDRPIEGILSLYKEDGITFYPMATTSAKASYRTAYMYPQNMYKTGISNHRTWVDNMNLAEYTNSWGATGNKGVHDPCPAGWRVCKHEDYYPLFKSNSYNPGTANLINTSSLSSDRGVLISYDTNKKQYTYFNLSGYWVFDNEFGGIGTECLVWCRGRSTTNDGTGGWHLRFSLSGSNLRSMLYYSGWEQEALFVRCIQERK